MKSIQKEDNSIPFSNGRIHLSPEEALRAVQLEHLVEEKRESVMDYFLLRASLSPVGVEKRAWWILLSLMSFVERFHYFPHNKELNKFLGSVLHGPNVPTLPALQQVDLVSRREIQSDVARILRKKEEVSEYEL